MDEIINLGEYWDEGKLVQSREEITTATNLNSRYFALAYSLLQEARVVFDRWSSCYEEVVDPLERNRVTRSLVERIFHRTPDNPPRCRNNPRHLFASAITPGGITTHLASLVDKGYTLHQVKGNPGTGVDKILSAVSSLAEFLGMQVQNYHNPFIPEHLEAVILPDIAVAVVDTSGWIVNTAEPLTVHPSKSCICLDDLVDSSRLARFSHEIEDARTRFSACLAGAISCIRNAKEVHDRLEEFYIPAMDFTGVEIKRRETRERILALL